MSEANKTTQAPVPQMGAFFYTDGAANPTNPGNTGYSYHGCLYKFIDVKQGSGNPTHRLTNYGYRLKNREPDTDGTEDITVVDCDEDGSPRDIKEVVPHTYFDAVGSQIEPNSNQYAELMAMSMAMEKACECDIVQAAFITDSEYVRIGVLEHLQNWIERGWTRRDGSPITNQPLWKNLYRYYNTLRVRGVRVTIDWVPGHHNGLNNSYGNLIADVLAVVGSRRSAYREGKIECKISEPQGYWKTEVERNPFIYNRRMYFNTLPESQIKGEYLLGEHGTDDAMLGKRLPDGAYSVVQLSESCPMLEYLRLVQSNLSNNADTMVMARLDALFSPEIFKYISDYGNAYLEPTRSHLKRELSTVKKIPITKDLNPPLIAARAMDALSELKTILNSFKDGTLDGFTINDATDQIYDIVETKKKDKVVRKVEIKKALADAAWVEVPVTVKLASGEYKPTIKINLGLDIPNRNALKKMESSDTKVLVITWAVAADVFKYATIIHNQSDYGIWAGYYSNTIIVPPEKWLLNPQAGVEEKTD